MQKQCKKIFRIYLLLLSIIQITIDLSKKKKKLSSISIFYHLTLLLITLIHIRKISFNCNRNYMISYKLINNIISTTYTSRKRSS